jgi:hypothetical protein
VEQFHPADSNETSEKSHSDDASGTPAEPMPPLGVLIVADGNADPSPIAVLQSTEATVAEESPNVKAFRASYRQTEDGVHLSIPVAPAPLPLHLDFNYDYDDGRL